MCICLCEEGGVKGGVRAGKKEKFREYLTVNNSCGLEFRINDRNKEGSRRKKKCLRRAHPRSFFFSGTPGWSALMPTGELSE